MVSGSDLTPKGGLDKMLAAHQKNEERPKQTADVPHVDPESQHVARQ